MRCFLTGFRIALSQRMRGIKSWLILLLIPLFILGIQTILPKEQVSAPVLVGVALPDEGGEEFWELLNARSGTVLTFIRTDAETIDRNVAAGRWDCGVILTDDFAKQIANADTDRICTIHVGEGSVVYPLVQETVSSCIIALVRVPIAEDYLHYSGITQSEEALYAARARLKAVLDAEDRVNIKLSTSDGESMDTFDLADNGIDNFLRWMIAVSLLIWLLLCVADLGRWSSSGAVKRMLPLRSATGLMCAHFFADSLVAMIAGCLGVLALGDGFSSCIAVIAYVLFWSCLGIVLARFEALWQSIPVLPAFAAVLSLLFSGVLVDISIFIPNPPGIFAWVPGKIFLSICQGQWHLIFPLLGTAGLCLLLSAFYDMIKKRCAK